MPRCLMRPSPMSEPDTFGNGTNPETGRHLTGCVVSTTLDFFVVLRGAMVHNTSPRFTLKILRSRWA